MTIRDYETTPASNNLAPPNGWPEGQAASTVNDCARQMMAEIRETHEEAPYFDWGDDPTRVDNDTFTLATDLTARYPVGARIKLVGATTGFARITSSVFGAVTTIDVVMDSGNVPTSLVRVAVQPSSGSSATPTSVSLTASTAGTAFAVSRADHGHVLSEAIAPTWSARHTFTQGRSSSQATAILLSSSFPFIIWDQSNAAANNRYWDIGTVSEQLLFRIANDADNTTTNWLTVDRTGTTVDRVAFPAVAGFAHLIGVLPTGPSANTPILGVNSNSSNSAAQFENTSATAPTVYIGSDQTGGNTYVHFYDGGDPDTSTGTITTNGTTTAYNTTSDASKKQNIGDSPSAMPLLSLIRPRQYDWIKDGSHSDYGLVAQELFEVCPYAVHVAERGNWGVDHSKLVPLVIKAVQEQQAQLQSLTARLAALEGGAIEVKPR